MNKTDVKKIAQIITSEQLQEMFNAAKIGVKDWTKVSNVNKGMTKGVSWNILAKDFDVSKTHHIMAKVNMIREFGDFLPDDLKIKKQVKKFQIPIHQDPKF